MAQLVVRKLGDDIKEQLRSRAKRNGRSLEAEARDILVRSLNGGSPARESKPGWAADLAQRMKKIGVTHADVEELERNIADLRKTWRTRDVNSGK